MTIDQEKLQSKSLKSKALRIVISVFIVFHLFVIIIIANGGSYLGRSLQKYLLPYANTIGLNTTWNFFSPDPAHTMYIRYVQYFDDAEGNEVKEPVESFIPPEKEKISTDSSKRRFLYAMRFLLLDTSRMNTVLAPWLCRTNPEISSLTIEQIFESIPSLDTVVLNRESDVERMILDASVTNMQFRYNCQQARVVD